MTFKEVKQKVSDFLADSRKRDAAEAVDEYFRDVPAKDCVKEAEELLVLLAKGTGRPQTKEDLYRCGNVGVIALGTHYAYPLLLTVLDIWVMGVYRPEEVATMSPEEKLALHDRLKKGTEQWDWQGLDAHRNNIILERLVPPEPAPGILKKLGFRRY